jgi:hypothetical protein
MTVKTVSDPTGGAGWTVGTTTSADGKTKITVMDETGYVMAEGSKDEVAARLGSIPQNNFTKNVIAEVNNSPTPEPVPASAPAPTNSSAEIAKDYNGAVQTDASGRIDPATVSNATPTILGGNMRNPDDTIAPDFSVKKEGATEPGSVKGQSYKDKQQFEPQPNILSQYANYSYAISFYILTNDQINYHLWLEPGGIPKNQLIVQTGGISVEDRNPYFDVDFFIDDLSIDSIAGIQGGGKSTSATNISFKITEPYGMTFMDRYFAAVSELTSSANPVLQPLLLEIKFYANDMHTLETTPIVTKYIPILMKDIVTKMKGSAVEYVVSAIASTDGANFDSAASIQEPIEIAASTVDEFFNNLSEVTEIKVAKQYKEAPESSVPQKGTILTKGLAAILNEREIKLSTKNGDKAAQYEYPNKYTFNISPEIGKCKLAKTGDNTLLTRTSMTDARGVTVSSQLADKTQVVKKDRLYSVASGMTIPKLAELMLHTSEFITRQQNQIEDETGKSKAVDQDNSDVLQWFRIFTKVELLEFDKKRNENAKHFIYTIEPYNINSTRTPGFKSTPLKGVHKVYNYWFTGDNTEILRYEQTYNMMLKQTYASYVNDTGFEDLMANEGASQAVDDYRAAMYVTSRTDISTQNTEARAAQIAVDAATSLYNPTDLKETNIEIFGDPAWIQTELYNNQGFTPRGPYTEDGSVNAKVSEAVVAIRFNISSDYNLDRGLQDYNDASNLTLGKSNIATKKTFDTAFRAHNIKHIFNNGKFTQELKLGLFPKTASDEVVKTITQTAEANANANNDEENRREAIKNAPRHQDVNKPRITGLPALPDITKPIKLKTRDELKAAAQDTIDSATITEVVSGRNPYTEKTFTEVYSKNSSKKTFNPMTREWVPASTLRK